MIVLSLWWCFFVIKGNSEIRKRVVIAMGLLVSAKLLNVAVPFLFKFAVDHLNTHLDSPLHLDGDPQTAILSATYAILIGCTLFSTSTWCSGVCNKIVSFQICRWHSPLWCRWFQRIAKRGICPSCAAFGQSNRKECFPTFAQFRPLLPFKSANWSTF